VNEDKRDTVVPEAEDGAGDAKTTDDTAKPETREAQIKRRVIGAMQDEIDRLDELASECLAADNTEGHCHALESLAAVKARGEVYCIQVEMAMQTAALATIIGGQQRARQQQPVPVESDGQLADLLKRGSRPGEGKPAGD